MAELAVDARVILLERESYLGYHATGRSAAFFAPAYGNAVVRGLTGASEKFFRQPPPDFTETALLRPRDSTGGDLDVDAILQGYLRLFRRGNGV